MGLVIRWADAYGTARGASHAPLAAMIEVQHLTKRFVGRTAVDDLSGGISWAEWGGEVDDDADADGLSAGDDGHGAGGGA